MAATQIMQVEHTPKCSVSKILNETVPNRDHLFISYATEDFRFVDWLCLRLAREGYLIWCDRLKLLGGESWPKEIDSAIKLRSFRLLAVLSKSSLNKDNPLKERTMALNLGRERKEKFIIPLNLDGLKPIELNWTQSDITFIPFSDSWFLGLKQLLKKLTDDGAPKSPSAEALLSKHFEEEAILETRPERLWTNMLEIVALPSELYRYESAKTSNAILDSEVFKQWPYFRESASTCWSFEPPSENVKERLKLSQHGKIVDWRSVTGPDALKFLNIGKKVLNRAVHHKMLSVGLEENADGDVYVPKALGDEKYPFQNYSGETKLKLGGVRNFWISGKHVSVRYHFAVYPKAYFDLGGKDFIQFFLKLHLTELDGIPVPRKSVQSRRRQIARSWWNHQWISRLMAITSMMADGNGAEIPIGTSGLKLSRYPTQLEIPVGFDEAKLAVQREAAADVELMDRGHANTDEEIIEDSSETEE